MEIVAVTEKNEEQAIAVAAKVLFDGGIVLYPTETFYGIGARFDSESALARVSGMKQRPDGKPLPLIVGSRSALDLAAFPPGAGEDKLIRRFWPGPLTLLLRAKPGISALLTAGTGEIAIRIPGPSFAFRLAAALPFPITSTSANPSGLEPAQSAGQAIEYFKKTADLLIDAGQTPGGQPSTIVRAANRVPTIVREGMIPVSAILEVLRDE